MESPEKIISILDNPSEEEKELVKKAYEFSKASHEGQKGRAASLILTTASQRL